MKILYSLLLIITQNLYAQSYNHPGAGQFFEIGAVQNSSPFGYQVYSPYAVPRFVWSDLTIESSRLDYDLISNDFIKIGPMVSYNFTPYAGTEIESIKAMERSGFLDYGILTEFSLGLGQLFIKYTRTTHDRPGNIFKMAYGTGVPLLALNSNHIWLNIFLEYTNYSSNVASYFFGVRENEATSSRSEKEMKNLSSFTQIYGLWTPITSRIWLTFTYRYEKFHKDILDSPIVIRRYDQSILAGLMMTFN